MYFVLQNLLICSSLPGRVMKKRVAEWMPGEIWTKLSTPVSVEEVRETENGERWIPSLNSRGHEKTT